MCLYHFKTIACIDGHDAEVLIHLNDIDGEYDESGRARVYPDGYATDPAGNRVTLDDEHEFSELLYEALDKYNASEAEEAAISRHENREAVREVLR